MGGFETCGFPNYKAGITCEHEAVVLSTQREYHVNKAGVPNGTKMTIAEEVTTGVTYLQKTDGTAHSITVTDGIRIFSEDGTKFLKKIEPWETLEAFAPGWEGLVVDPKSHSPPLTDMCSRTQCINNNILSSRDYPQLFFFGECFFIVVFTLEILVRAFVMRSCKQFFFNFANIIDMTAAGVALGEIVFIPLSWGEAKYEVWGMGSLADPAIFRVTRILVAVRFISLQRQTGGLKVIGNTLWSTWRKLVIPSVFFFLFVLIFAGIYYTFESGSLYACPDDRLSMLNDGFVHKDFIEPYLGSGAFAPDNCKVCVEEELYSKSDRKEGMHINKYDGACTLLVLKGDNTMSMTAIEDMFDAMWTMTITMTTVGYGGKYPYTSSGKIVAVVSAILGSLYIAMPLTIVGNKFYDVYLKVETEKAKAELKSAQLTYQMKKRESAKKVTPVVKKKTGGENPVKHASFKLGHIITLKRWVLRTKKKLEVHQLSDADRDKIHKYLKVCRKICHQDRYTREELVDLQEHHKQLTVIMSRHLIHKHAEGIDTVESTLY